MTDSWEPLTATTLTEKVYQALRDRILAGKVASGAFIREQEVSEGLGVSRTPVRESLGRLASEGFLERIPHRGFRVPKESIAELVELYPIIGTLELLAARLSFPRINDNDTLARIRAVNRDYELAKRRNDIGAGIELNNQFHHQLSEKCGNRRLCELLDELRMQVKRLEVWAFSDINEWDASIREHDEILQAIESKDYERGLAVLEKNRLTTYNDFVKRLVKRESEDTVAVEKRA